MKIKKKEYENKLNDMYWKGVEVGINFAVNNPSMAERYKDNIPLLRKQVQMAGKVVVRLADALRNMLNM